MARFFVNCCIFSLIIPFLLALTGWICGAIALKNDNSVWKEIPTIINALIVIASILLLIGSIASA